VSGHCCKTKTVEDRDETLTLGRDYGPGAMKSVAVITYKDVTVLQAKPIDDSFDTCDATCIPVHEAMRSPKPFMVRLEVSVKIIELDDD
jgi:hypothetical protein